MSREAFKVPHTQKHKLRLDIEFQHRGKNDPDFEFTYKCKGTVIPEELEAVLHEIAMRMYTLDFQVQNQ